MKTSLLTPKRVFFLMIGLLVVVLGIAGASVYFGNSFLVKQSDKLVALKLQYKIPEANQTALRQAKVDIDKYTDLKNVAKTIVPQQKDQAQAVREIVSYATDTKIQILSITFPSSNLGQTSTLPLPGSTSSKAATGSTGTVVITPPVSQVQPVQGIPGLYVLPITVQSDPASPVTFSQVTAFLSKLEQNRRTAQVGTISITPQKDSTSSKTGLSFTITVNVYIKP